MIKKSFIVVSALLCFLLLVFGLQLGGLEWHRFFGKRKEDVRRDIIERSQSWVEGKQQQLSKLYLEYKRADDPQDKAAIGATVRHRFSTFDADLLNDSSQHLRTFLKQAKRGEL